MKTMGMKTMGMKTIGMLWACMLVTACAQDFPVVELNPDEQKFEAELQATSDSDAQLTLASMYVMHNKIDKADSLLSSLVVEDGKNPQVLAWKAANDCKKAGRRGPWLMGLDKMWLVRECLADLDNALAAAPDDFVVQMVHMSTASEVNMFDSLSRAATTRDRIDSFLQKQPDAIPPDTNAQFQIVAAAINRKQGQMDAARARLAVAAPLATTESTRSQLAHEQEQLARMSKSS